MAISVAVPKNLSGIKTKVAMNLTKRQLICFGGAAAVGIPFYLVTKGVLGTQASALIMVALMLPFFFLAMYEKDGFPAEKILYFMLRQKLLTPGIRPYKSENLYKQLEEREKLKKEVRYLEEKAAGQQSRAESGA
ncbi:MAG: PrgI family protein [Lachnospiraceae bacterium]